MNRIEDSELRIFPPIGSPQEASLIWEEVTKDLKVLEQANLSFFFYMVFYKVKVNKILVDESESNLFNNSHWYWEEIIFAARKELESPNYSPFDEIRNMRTKALNRIEQLIRDN